MVYAKPPFAGPRKLVNYLARYTHRVAISNDRLLDCRDGQVRYTYRDRQDGDRRKVDTLPAAEFLQRFLQHVLPDGFCRIRHYGLLANCVKRQRLAHCRRLLGVHLSAVVEEPPHTAAEWMEALLGIDITQCPRCGVRLQITRLPRPCASPPLSHLHPPRPLCPNRFLPGCPSDKIPNSKPRATRRYAAKFNGVLSVIAARRHDKTLHVLARTSRAHSLRFGRLRCDSH